MPNFDSYLYANGALRLTRHGKGRGETSLVRQYMDGSTDQIDVPDQITDSLREKLEAALGSGQCNASLAFSLMADRFADARVAALSMARRA